MKKNVLIVYAHPEPASLTRQLVELSVQTLQEQGHEGGWSVLYARNWKAVFDENDFPNRSNANRISSVSEAENTYSKGQQAPDIDTGHHIRRAADQFSVQ